MFFSLLRFSGSVRPSAKMANPKPKPTKVADLYEVLCDFKKDILAEITEIKSQVCGFMEAAAKIEAIEKRVDKQMTNMQRQIDNLEGHSRRSNVIFYGIPEEDEESWETSETKVLDLTKSTMEIAEDIRFDRVHRLGRRKQNSPRPIIAKLTYFKDKQKIFQKAGKLKGSRVSVSEDYTKSVRVSRQKLVPHLKAARAKGKSATLQYDKLSIEGEKYAVNNEGRVVSLRTGNELTLTEN